MKSRIKATKVVNTKHGVIEKHEDKMFGGWEYVVFHPNGDCILRTNSFDEAMQKLKNLRMELKVF